MNLSTFVGHVRVRLGRLYGAITDRLPEPVRVRVSPKRNNYTMADIPAPPVIATTAKARLYIAPVNFASQSWLWARAVEQNLDVPVTSMQYRLIKDYGFPSDNPVPVDVVVRSESWQRAQFDAVVAQYTHVLIEAGRPIFGQLFGESVEEEVRALRAAGLTVGFISHGSDLRQPIVHRQRDVWSPFHDEGWDALPGLEQLSAGTIGIYSNCGGAVFVSTPELLLDWPDATWLPVVVDADRWATEQPLLAGDTLTVLHAPTNPVVKGTPLIEPVLEQLSAEKLVDYVRVRGVDHSVMPELYASSDIVLEQFRLGIYSVTACEGMAAGRLVIAHVSDSVRATVKRVTGLDVPIVQATPDTLDEVLRDIHARRDHYREIAARGPAFVRAAHDGRLSAEALAPFLGLTPDA